MKTVGFIMSNKENEKRRALLPQHIKRIKNAKNIYIETGYGAVLGIDDEAYIQAGCQVAARSEVMGKDIICDPKIGDADYLHLLKRQTLFGWVHAVQNRDITDKIVANDLTAFAWEDMYEDGRHLFWRNNEVAGEAAIMHAFQLHGLMPYNTKVAILGRGNIARGALKILTLLGAEVTVYDRRTEKLFQKELPMYDVVVNAILWDTTRKDHIIYESDLPRMKKGSMLVDVSCDRHGGIETSEPTSIEDPVYTKHGVLHYCVDHTPTLFYKTATHSISEVVSRYIDELIEGCPSAVLKDALIVEDGKILDQAIIDFQGR